MEKEHIAGSRPSTENTLHEEMHSQPAVDLIAAEQIADSKENGKEASNTEDDDQEWITGFKLITIMVSVTLVAFLILLDASIIATAIPRITNQFHSVPDIGWYGSAYLLANCSLQPLTGKIYTYFSSKRVFLIFLFIFEIGSLLCGVATSSNMLIVGRAVAGAGGSGLVNGAITILNDSVPLAKRPPLLGLLISIAQVGTICGPLIGGALTQYTTWRWCFYINLPAGGVAAAMIVAISIPERLRRLEGAETLRAIIIHKLDLAGFAIFAPAIIMLLLALEWGGNKFAWNSATIIGLIVGSVVVIAIFFVWEYHVGDNAMVPFSVVKNRIMWTSCLVTFFMMASLLLTTYYLPIWFQVVKDNTPTLSGVHLLPLILSQIFFATLSGIIVGKQGYYLPWVIASTVLQTIASGLLTTLTPSTPVAKWIGYQILGGSGRGMGIQMAFISTQNALPAAVIPVATAIVIFCQYFGGALFLSVGQTIFTNGLRRALPLDAPGVDVDTVIGAGATGFRNVVPEPLVAGVVESYNTAVTDTFILSTALCGVMFLASWGMGWVDIRKKKTGGGVVPEA